MQGIPFRDVSYCKYGMPYRKLTRIWTDLGDDYWTPRPTCLVENCSHKAQFGCHAKSAQRRPCIMAVSERERLQEGGEKRTHDHFTREELYTIPAELCDEIAKAASRKCKGKFES